MARRSDRGGRLARPIGRSLAGPVGGRLTSPVRGRLARPVGRGRLVVAAVVGGWHRHDGRAVTALLALAARVLGLLAVALGEGLALADRRTRLLLLAGSGDTRGRGR